MRPADDVDAPTEEQKVEIGEAAADEQVGAVEERVDVHLDGAVEEPVAQDRQPTVAVEGIAGAGGIHGIHAKARDMASGIGRGEPAAICPLGDHQQAQPIVPQSSHPGLQVVLAAQENQLLAADLGHLGELPALQHPPARGLGGRP